MEKKKILFVSQEITPYLPESRMSKIVRYLPQGVQEREREIRTFMPRFGNINERRNQLHEVIRLSGMNLVIDDTDHPLIIKVASIQSARMQVYFIDNEDFFQRKATLNDGNGNPFEDNDERAVFFARGVLETVKKLRWSPDIVHCHGWFSALVPLYLKNAFREDPLFHESKVIYSVYNDDFKGSMHSSFKDKVKIDGINDGHLEVINDPNYVNLSKLAINMSDAIAYGDETINPEIESYIQEKSIPVIGFNDFDEDETKYIETFNKFYNKVLKGDYAK